MKRLTNFILAASLLLPFAFSAASALDEGGWNSTNGYSLHEIRELTQSGMTGGVAIDIEAPPVAARARTLIAVPSNTTALTQSSFATTPIAVVAGNFADQITPEIQALARGLQYDPLNIFHFVRNRIAYECYYGSKKGAHLTLMEMGGNDYDQSSLLVALLRASGYPASYVAGPVSFTYGYLSSATGIENSYAHLSDADFAAEVSTAEDPVTATDPRLAALRKQYGISGFFLNRGWPIVDASADATRFTLSHVWVRCTVGGQEVNVSPSVKAYSRIPGSSVAPAGMNKSAILSAAAGTVDTVGGKNWVKGLQYSALSTLLSGYTNQVLTNLKTNHDSESMDDLLGTAHIVPVVYPSLTAAIQISAAPEPWSSIETWSGTAIPADRMSRVEFSGADYYSNGAFGNTPNSKPLYQRSYTMAELAGRKLSLTFNGTGSKTATFSLDDTLDSTFTMFGFLFCVETSVIHPHYSIKLNLDNVYEKKDLSRHNYSNIITYNSRINQFTYPSNTVPSCYAIVSGFENPRKLLRKRQEVLEKLRKTYLDTDERVRTEILNVLGLNWYDQTWRHSHFAASQQQMLPLFQHRIGTVGQQESYFIDIAQQLYSIDHSGGDEKVADKFLGIESLIHSAMEHGVVNQSVGQPVAVSTVEMLWQANQAGEAIYRMQSSNWNAEKNNLVGYSAADTAFLDSIFALSGSIGLMPKTGNRLVNSWRGTGYATITSERLHSMRISGGINGGFASVNGYIGSNPLLQYLWSDPAYTATPSNVVSPSITPHTTPRQISWDPVDLLSGAYVLDETDLKLGRLSFSRHYNSHQRNNDQAGLGGGWTHDNDIRLAERTSTLAALGETNTYQAAAVYVGALATSMVYDNDSAKDWSIAALITRWATDMTFNNAVGITFGNRTVEFIKMPDGTFIAPPGMNYTLTKTGGSPATASTPAVLGIYTLKERNGLTFLFNAKGRIFKITDPNSNTQTFNYNGSNQLTTVVDSFGQTFTYGWVANKIETVSDGTGRIVTLGYTSGNLTTVKDVENKTHSYQYDSENRMESQKNAKSDFTIVNYYDSGNRVIRQRSMGLEANEWLYGWGGFLNLEQNPAGNISGYQYDEKGRSIGVSNALGFATKMKYDGQDRLISTADAKGAEILSTWNNDNTLATETDAEQHLSQFFYDGLKRLNRITDRRGHDTHFIWTDQHQLETITDPLQHVITNAYYTTGKLKSIKDAETKLTSFKYKPDGFLYQTIYSDLKTLTLSVSNRGETLTSTDAENRIITNTYNNRSQIKSITLPPIPGDAPAVTTYVYDDIGNLEQVTDAKLNVTKYAYNALSNPFTTTLPAITTSPGISEDNVITSEYDVRDWPKWVTNSATHKTTQQSWTDRGEKFQATDALTKYSENGYDNNGNLTDYTNRRGKLYHSAYDNANRLESSATPTLKTTNFTYFNNNLIQTLKEPSTQTTIFTYNGRNLVESKTDPTGAIGYIYDDSGLLKTVTEDVSTINRTYDERGRLKTFTTADGDLIKYQYDANNNLTRLTYPPDTSHPLGKQVNYTYNSRNLLETVTDWSSRATTYTYDRLGRLTGTLRPNGTSNKIAHDAADQLLSIKEIANGKLFSYLNLQYDAIGQIKKKLRAPLVNTSWQHPTFTATYDNDNRLATINGTSVVHDADGNMTTGPFTSTSGNVTLEYNSRNQLTLVGLLNTPRRVEYIYDAEGRRRSFADTAGLTRDTIDPSGKLLIRTAPGGVKTYYVYGLGLLYEANAADQTKTYHFDQVGSTIARTNDSGIVIGQAGSGQNCSAWSLLTNRWALRFFETNACTVR